VIAFSRFETDQYDKVPFFVFGDFNFRLDTNQLVKVCLLVVCSGNEDYIPLYYGDKCFQGKNFSHFARVKSNRKDGFSVDI